MKHDYDMDKKTRIKSAHKGETPIAGAPQPRDAHMAKATRVSMSPGLPRKNDPPEKAQSRMGLNVGTRVTSKDTRTRGSSYHGK